MGTLDGKAAIVTGSGRGIGRGIALEFAREGARVAVASRTASTVDAVVAEIEAAGGTAIGITCDLGRPADLDRMVDTTVTAFGTVDVLVNNGQSFVAPGEAPHAMTSPFEEYPEARWEAIFATGVTATFRAMKLVFPHMKERGGRIINFGSPASQRGKEGYAGYNACKEAIRGLTRTAAREWGRHGITCNVISPTIESGPGFFDGKAEVLESVVAQIPVGRLGIPRDAGRLAVFLAGPDSGYLNGMTFMLDGGKAAFSL